MFKFIDHSLLCILFVLGCWAVFSVLFLLHNPEDNDHVFVNHSNQSDKTLIPVVYSFFVNGDESDTITDTSRLIPSYSWKAMMVTANHGNHVVLITHPSVVLPKGNHAIELYDMSLLESDHLFKFRQSYMPWGLEEPWEQQNIERYFILAAFMEIEKVPLVFFADSDVVVVVPIISLVSDGHDKCDGLLSLRVDDKKMKWDRGDWDAWAGTSLLKKSVMDSFVQFAISMYQPEYISFLEFKRDNWPFVCDMTLWYLFVGASDNRLSRVWEWPDPRLPNTSMYSFCDITEIGFAHDGGYFKYDDIYGVLVKLMKNSVHFQGYKKRDISLIHTGSVHPKKKQIVHAIRDNVF
jgi:hypothetical protein